MAVVEADPARVTLLDPLSGQRRIPRARFEAMWNSEVLLVLPTTEK